MNNKPITLCLVAILTTLLAGSAFAQDIAPTPKRSPRVPVSKQALPDHKVLQSRDVRGAAVIIDGEKLRIGDIDLRLFGVVPPQLSASYGPQARAVLDKLTDGQAVDCMVRDRDHDGRFLATCRVGATDLALELLRHGLAVTARGSLQPTELAGPYLAAEQAAQTQKLGLWSVSMPQGVAVPVPAATAPLPQPAPAQPAAIAVTLPQAPPEVKKEEKPAALAPVPPLPKAQPAEQATAPAALQDANEAADDSEDAPGVFARYQLLITGLVMLVTAFGIMGVISFQRRRERREEIKAVAAALRGELLAARAVCQARLKIMEADDRPVNWPKIRTTLYTAYVGRLGWLGAVLARQIASIYGQAADYAAYYNSTNASTETAAKRLALQVLIQHVDEVLPRLALIEQTGQQINPTLAAIAEAKVSPEAETPSTAPVPPPAAVPASEIGLRMPWNAVRKFARDRFNELKAQTAPPETSVEADYAALVEAEMASLTFSEEDGLEAPPSNVTKFRGIGS